MTDQSFYEIPSPDRLVEIDGITLLVKHTQKHHCADDPELHCITHNFEVLSHESGKAHPREAHPLSETGYRSVIVFADTVDAAGTPERFINRMIEDAANKKTWQRRKLENQQLNLFQEGSCYVGTSL